MLDLKNPIRGVVEESVDNCCGCVLIVQQCAADTADAARYSNVSDLTAVEPAVL